VPLTMVSAPLTGEVGFRLFDLPVTAAPCGSAEGDPLAATTPPLARFHLAIPVDDLEAARKFYGAVIGCPEGRSGDTWVDWDFHGHQLVTHLAPRPAADGPSNLVDGIDVTIPHFGLLLTIPEFGALARRLQEGGTVFLVEPYLRFAGVVGEQRTMFLRDPAGNALEFKAFADDTQVFAT
jgi:extradiol dioxygenase family protein